MIDTPTRIGMKAGTQLTAKHKGVEYLAEVVQGEKGLVYRLAGGREFRSPSAAGKAITGSAVNGWKFWNVVPA